VMPELRCFESMKEIWDWQNPIPEDSSWFANLKIPDNWH
jgi:hypothetical protein